MTCAPSEYSDQPGHLPRLIVVFAINGWWPKVSSCGLRRLWSDWARLIWVFVACTGHSVGFVMQRLTDNFWISHSYLKCDRSWYEIFINIILSPLKYLSIFPSMCQSDSAASGTKKKVVLRSLAVIEIPPPPLSLSTKKYSPFQMSFTGQRP